MSAGFYGKIPGRGDFVRHGLATATVAALDAWWQEVIPGSQAVLGTAWRERWMEAPVWRFHVPPGVFGAEAMAGVWLPSTDRVGRLFPLTLAMTGDVAGQGAFLDAAEAAGRAAIETDMGPEELALRLGVRGGAALPPAGTWWSEGGPAVAAARYGVARPGVGLFARMLVDSLATPIKNEAAGGTPAVPGSLV